MFRFTIRDVLWLTVVVALGVGWWLDKRQTEGRIAVVAAHAESLQTALKAAHANVMLRESQSVNPPSGRRYVRVFPPGPAVDWGLADKPIPR